MATFHQISSQNLTCRRCQSHFNQQELLECSHTFCKDCLELDLEGHPDQLSIVCPVCRDGDSLLSGNGIESQTNAPLDADADADADAEVKTKNPTCTVCETDEKQPAVSYCRTCRKYMCKLCDISHFSEKASVKHEVVGVSGVREGNVPLERKCKTHTVKTNEKWYTHYITLIVCSLITIYCVVYFPSMCGMLEHLQADHQQEKTPEKAVSHDETIIKTVNDLRRGAKSKKTTIENHIKVIETQRKEMTNILGKLSGDIDKTYEKYMKLLSARREVLKYQVKRLTEKFANELQTMEEESHQTISNMTALEKQITKGMEVPLEKEGLFVHDTLCENLKSFLGRDDPDDQSPRGVTERAQKMSFSKYEKVNELHLGELEGYTWDVKVDVKLPNGESMNCMTRATDGKIAVGSWKGGIHLYSPDGELQRTVLKDISIRQHDFLSDGRSVVRDMKNKMSLYTPQWEKLDLTFETISEEAGDKGGLTVDRDDNIYVGYVKLKKIQVFTPQGGKAVREIMCGEYIPQQLVSFHTMDKLILTDTFTVVGLDDDGKKENVLMKDQSMFPYPVVCRDDSVIVAWVKYKEGFVSIDRYTRDLKHMRNLISDFKIQKREIHWYYLLELESGEIAFSTPDRLYIIFDVRDIM